MTLQNRTLFFGDNLQVIEEKIPENFFDLIYLDPPFNSNRNYNVLFKEGKVDSTAQLHAFEDTWEWTPPTIRLFDELKESHNPQIAILMNSLYEILKDTPMMAYLVNMTARLIPLRKVLKNTGSIYLHCDPTASHYLKMVMDTIFGLDNFINEIVWCYASGGVSKRYYGKKHDIILFYSKTRGYKFNTQYRPYSEGTLERGLTNYKKRLNEKYELRGEGAVMNDWWSDITPLLSPTMKERLGYPTQKPEALLERVIKGSTDKNDWVLDPFCGCGTTIAVAENLGRNWVGIDISMQAVNVIQRRMNFHYPDITVNIDGIPMDYESAQALAVKDKFAFQDWAITLVGANPPSGVTKKGADRGIDGLILFRDKVDYANPKLRKILVQVKGGGSGRGDVAKLKGDIEREDAPMGILITLHEPTAEMKREAALAGEYKYTESSSFPRIQILSIRDWFAGKEVKIPSDKVSPFKNAEAKGNQPSLL